MNGVIFGRTRLVVDEMVEAIRKVEKLGGRSHGGICSEDQNARIVNCFSSATVALQERQIELDEETADRMVAAIDRLTEVVKADRFAEVIATNSQDEPLWRYRMAPRTVQVEDEDSIDESLGDA